MKRLIIFDVCNTFVKTNSTYSYIKFLINAWIKPFYRYILFLKWVSFLYSIVKTLTWLDYEIKFIWFYFKWIEKEKLSEVNNKFFKWYEWQISKKFERIVKNSRWSKVIFLSAAINPPIDFLKKKFWIDGFSSVLEEKSWIFTWKFVRNLWWQKESIFINNEIPLKTYEHIELYTDNIDDCNLILYLNKETKYLKVNIIPYKNIKYRRKFLNSFNINYEFIS